MRGRHALALGLLLSGAGSSLLAQPAPVRLRVEEAVARALSASERLEGLRALGRAAAANVSAQEADDDPLVTWRGSVTRTNEIEEFGVPLASGQTRVIFPNIPSNYSARVDLDWPIYTAGRAEALLRAARAESEVAAAELDRARADVRLETTRAYWALVTAREAAAVVERALAQVDRHLQDVRARLAAGLVPPNDVLSAKAERARQQALHIDAIATEEAAALALKRLLGIPLDTPVEPVTPLEAGPPGDEPVAALVARAREHRQDLRAARGRLEAARLTREASAAARRPVLSIAGGVDYARPNPRILPRRDRFDESWDLGVRVAWPIWDGGRADAAVARAVALEQARAAEVADLDGRLAVDVRQRRLELEAARARVVATRQGVESAREAHRVVGARFGVGVATSTDVLEAQVALLRAALDRTRALADVQLAEARLAHATGS